MNKCGIFMPGRLGGQRLLNKLILPMGDTCLWEIACKKLSQISDVDEKCVLICKEDTALNYIANKYNLKIIYRDPETAAKDSPLNFVFKDVEKMESDVIMFLNPCLPFLKIESVLYGFMFITEFNKYVESVKEFNSWIYDEHSVANIELDYTEMNTKFLPAQFEAAHAFRIFDKKSFLKDGNMSAKNTCLCLLNANECIDVDTKEDYEFARWKYEKNNS